MITEIPEILFVKYNLTPTGGNVEDYLNLLQSKDYKENPKQTIDNIMMTKEYQDLINQIEKEKHELEQENSMPISDKTRKEMLQYGAQYKQAHPHAKNRQIKRAVYSKFKIKP